MFNLAKLVLEWLITGYSTLGYGGYGGIGYGLGYGGYGGYGGSIHFYTF